MFYSAGQNFNSGQKFLALVDSLSPLSPRPNLFMNKGYETKETENQPSLKNFNLSMILTCNIFTFCIFFFTCGLIKYMATSF